MAEERRAVLHIGTEKTGSSSLQAFLAANRARLAARGVLYPCFPGPTVHEALTAYAMDDHRREDLRRKAGVTDARSLAAFRARLEREAAEEIGGAGCPIVILSSEHCASRLVSPGEIARLKGLLDPLFDRIDVAVYLRRQDRLAVSLYSTALKSGGTRETVLPGDARLDGMLDYAALLDRWAAVFGRHRVQPRLYGTASLAGGSVVSDFAETWDLGSGLQPVPRANESLRPEAQAFLRRLNGALAERERGDAEAAARLRGDPERALATAWSGKGRRPARADARAFAARFAASNEAVRRAWFPDRAALFDDDFDDYPETEEPEALDADTAVAMAATLWTHLRRRETAHLAAVANRDGQIAELSGETAEAAAHYARALAADPDDVFAARRLKALGEAGPPPRASWEWQRTGQVPPASLAGGQRAPWQADLLLEDRLVRLRKALSLNGLRRLVGLPPIQAGDRAPASRRTSRGKTADARGSGATAAEPPPAGDPGQAARDEDRQEGGGPPGPKVDGPAPAAAERTAAGQASRADGETAGASPPPGTAIAGETRPSAAHDAGPDRRGEGPAPALPPVEEPPAEALAAGRGTLFFLHIPKTAGTAVVRELSRAFPEETIYPEYNEHHFFGSNLPGLRERYRFIAAHAGWRVAAFAGDYVVTVLRDPADRVISLYNYWREVAAREAPEHPEGHPNPGVRLAGTESFEVFLESELDAVRHDIRETQAWMLAWSTLHDSRVALADLGEEGLFERAAANLRAMDAIGTTDDMPAFAADVERVLGLPLPVARVNVTARKAVMRESLAPETARRLDEITRVDRRLFEAVRSGLIRPDPALAAERRAALPPRPSAVARAAGAARS